jgi:hypothetical protein
MVTVRAATVLLVMPNSAHRASAPGANITEARFLRQTVSKESLHKTHRSSIEVGSRVESESADETDMHHFGGRSPIARVVWIIRTVPVDDLLLFGVRPGRTWNWNCALPGCHIVTDRAV